jgi:hypothetical protein
MVLRMALNSVRIAELAQAYVQADLPQTDDLAMNLHSTSWMETEALFKALEESSDLQTDQISFSYILHCGDGAAQKHIVVVLMNDEFVTEGTLDIDCATGVVRKNTQ